MIKLATSAILILGTIGLARAQDGSECTVADPTGTRLNVRTVPHGSVLQSVENGRSVRAIEHATDARSKVWVYIFDSATNAPLGWVFKDYLTCR